MSASMGRFTGCLLLLAAPVVLAQPSPGQWTTGVTNDKGGIYAATQNDDGFVFGKYCYFSSESCYWHVALDMGCEPKATYPVLAATDKGAASFELSCMGKIDERHYSYVFTNWKGLESLIVTGARLGIATPLESDRFRVYRFSLDGLTQATKEVETDFFTAVAKTKGKHPKTTTAPASETL